MARVGEEFPLQCPACGGDIRLISFITEPGPIPKILTHLGEPLERPPVSPARGPPTDWGELVQFCLRRTTRRWRRDVSRGPASDCFRSGSSDPTGTAAAGAVVSPEGFSEP
jgi:hypothetical protein